MITTGAIVQTYRYKPYGAKLSGGTVGLGFFWTGNTGSRSTGLKYAEQFNRAAPFIRKEAGDHKGFAMAQ
jgi:hypothetical protein